MIVHERLMTHGDQVATSVYEVKLQGKGSSTDVISRSVAGDNSEQVFEAAIVGETACSGHAECDAIIMDKARILAIPQLEANDLDAALIHEAAIGKIAGEQIIKLMTLGLTEEEAEAQIVKRIFKVRQIQMREDQERSSLSSFLRAICLLVFQKADGTGKQQCLLRMFFSPGERQSRLQAVRSSDQSG